MTLTIDQIIQDKRPIKMIVWFNDEPTEVGGPCAAHDKRIVTKIMPYGESGEYALVPWFAVFAGDEIVGRVPANQVAVYY